MPQQQQTFEVTAPNGKTLEITGDHVPTEAELKEIFAAAGVDVASSAPAPKQSGAIDRYLGGLVSANPVTNSVDFLSQMFTDPKGAGASVVNPSLEQLDQMLTAHREGRPLAAMGHAAGAIPLIGPFVAENVKKAQEGDAAGAMGALTWLASPAAKRGVKAGTGVVVDAAKKTPLRVPMNAAADALDRSANERLARTMSPQTGPNKTRLGNQMVKAAPDLLRDPELTGYTRSGVADKIASRYEQVAEGLDVAANERLVSQQVRTEPLLKQLDTEIGKLTAQPVEASKAPRTIKPTPAVTKGEQVAGITGEIAPSDYATVEPYGKAVEPQPNSSQLATLKQIRSEIAQLGPVADYEAIRRIREAWDKVAKVKYMPSTAQDVLKAQGDATGAAKGTGAMREALAQTDPKSAVAYRQYTLYKTAHDVAQAAEEADRVRPNRGRGIMARTAGALIGAKEGGAVGAGIGAMVAGIADKAAEMAPTFQVAIARRLAAVADALRSGDVDRAKVMTDRIVLTFPHVRAGVKWTGKVTAAAGRAAGTARLAADQQEPNQKP